MDTDDSCSFDGNSDLYGLGIRLGAYCSLLATLYAKYYLPTALKGTMTTNAIFIFAILIAVTKSASSAQLSPIKAFVMSQIMFGYILCGAESGSTSLWLISLFVPVTEVSEKYQSIVQTQVGRTAIAENGLNLLRTGVGCFTVWFWFYGVDELQATAPSCFFRIFFFRELNGHDRIRVLYQSASAIYLSFQITRHASILALSTQFLKKARVRFNKVNKSRNKGRYRWFSANIIFWSKWFTSRCVQERIFTNNKKR